LLCCGGFPHIRKLANGWMCLKSPYDALQTLEHWVRHVCLPMVSLGMHESFRHYISYLCKISGQKSVGIFFFTDFMIEFFSEWNSYLIFITHVVGWPLKNFLILGPYDSDSLSHIQEPIMDCCHIIKQKCSSFLYLPNKVLFRNHPIMCYVHCDMLLAFHVCTLLS